MSVYTRPHLYPLPSVFAALRRDRAEAKAEGGQERKQFSIIAGFADDRPANPLVSIFKRAANDSPSPGGEGQAEGVRHLCSLDVMAALEETSITPGQRLKISE